MRSRLPLYAALAVAACLVLAQPTHADSTAVFRVLIDSDNSAATGCTVAGAAPVAGIEQLLTTTVNLTATSASVVKVESQQCVGGTFAAPVVVDATGWPVGTNANGRSVVETYIPESLLGASFRLPVRLAFTASIGPATTAALLSAPNGGSILYPSISAERKHAIWPLTPARTITLDGRDRDWDGVDPLTPTLANGAGSLPLKLTNVYAFAGAGNLYFYLQTMFDVSVPAAIDDAYMVNQGQTLSVAGPGVLANDFDPLGNPLTAALVTPPLFGTVSLQPTGAFTYTQNGTPAPADSFQYTASNGTATSAPATVTIGIGANSPPVAKPDSYSVARGLTLTVAAPGVLANDSDPDGDKLTAQLVSAPHHGIVTLNANGSFTYVNDDSNNASDTFGYRLSDGTSIAGATVTITILPRNHAPSFAKGSDVTVLDTAGAQSFASWATSILPGPADEAGQTLNFVVTNDNNVLFSAQPAMSPAGTLTFTPIAGQTGDANVTVYLHDNGGIVNGGVDTSAAQTFVIHVDKIPAITSANAVTFQTGVAGTFTVTASARPPADIAESGALPAGVTFVNNGPPSSSNGTLAGTPAAGTGGVYPITFTATNIHGSSAPQSFTLTVDQPPAFTNASTTTFTVGSAGTFTITTSGFPVVGTIGETGALPNGVTFTNNGNGTATLAGTPAAGTGGTYTLTLSGSNGIAPNAAQTFTLVVDQAPAITSANGVSFAVNAASTFTITATGFPLPALTDSGALPAGMTFTDNGNGTATIAGTPTATGTFPIAVTATNAAGTANQTLTIQVWAPPAAVADAYQVAQNTLRSIAAPGVLGNDTVNGASISANSTPAHGTLTLNADGSFSYTPAAGYAGPDSFTYTLTNFAGTSTATVTLTVFAPPVANADSYQAQFNATTSIAAPGVLGNDSVNAAAISGNTVPSHGAVTLNADGSFSYTPTTGYAGADSFTYTLSNFAGNSTATVSLTVVQPPAAVADSYNAVQNTPLTTVAPGVLANDTVNGASIASYGASTGLEQTTIGTATPTSSGGSITVNADGSFTYTPAAGFAGTDTFKYVIANISGSSTAVVTFTVYALPVANADAYSVAINTAKSISAPGVLANDSINGATIVSYGAATGSEQTSIGAATPTSAGGSVTLNADGSFTYTPAAGFVGTDTFKYKLQNPAGSSIATVTFTVFQTPLAVNDSYTVPRNLTTATAAPGVLSNDTVNGANIASYGATAGTEQTSIGTATPTSAGGSITLFADGHFSYTPAAGFTGTDTFKYVLSNVAGSSTATVTFTVLAPPVAVNDGYNDMVNTALNIAAPGVLTNDTLNAATIVGYGASTGLEQASIGSATATSAGGSVALNASGAFAYTPAAGFTGADTFKYTIQNVAGPSVATVTITVYAPPSAVADTYQTPVNTTLNTSAPGVLSNDSVNAATIVSYGAATGAEQTSIGSATPTSAGGSVTVNANGSFSYTPPSAVFTGADSFKYVLQNPVGSSTATVTINVVPPPSAVNDSYATGVDTPLTVAAPGVLGNDVVNSAAITSYGASTGLEQTSIGTPTPTSSGGSVTLNANGSFTYTPASAFAGTDTFKYVLTNASGTSTGTVTITVLTPPAAVADNYTAGENITLNQAAPGVLSNDAVNTATIVSYGATTGNEQGLIGTATATSAGGSITLFADGHFSYTPAAGFTGTDTFKYVLQNGAGSSTATVTFTVQAPPVAVADSDQAGENLPLSIAAPGVLSNDTVNGATIASYGATTGLEQTSIGTATATSAGGSITLFADGHFSYTPAAGFTGTDTFKYVLTNAGGTSTATVTITVVPPPVATADSFTKAKGSTTTTAAPGVLSNDTVNSATIASYGATTGAEQTSIGTATPTSNGGSVALFADGHFTYTAPNTSPATDTFKYVLTNAAGSSTATVTITVLTPVTATADSYGATGNISISVPATGVLGNDTGDSITIKSYGASTGGEQTSIGSATATSSGGSVTLNADGSFLYTPPANFVGADTFKYAIDNALTTPSTATVTITVANRVIFLDSAAGAGDGTLATPCSTTACVSALPAIASGKDLIYIINRGASYSGTLTLKASQFVSGGTPAVATAASNAGFAIAPNSVTLPAATSAPTLTASGADVVFVNSGNVLQYLNLSNSSNNLINGNTPTGLTVSNVTLNPSGTAKGFNLPGAAGTITVSSTTMSGTTSATMINAGGGAGTWNFTSSPITQTAGPALIVTGKTGGGMSFDATSTIASSGNFDGAITLSSAIGTYSFGGALTLNTSSGRAFIAASSGTVTVTGTGSTLTSTSNTALDFQNTTIGASGLNFRSINASGGAFGIVLTNTGSSGGLNVSGNGGLCDSTHTTASDCTGGTIQNTITRGAQFTSTSNVSLNNMYFKNASSTVAGGCVADIGTGANTSCNGPVFVQTATNVALTKVYISGGKQMGIVANGVTNLTMTTCEVSGIGSSLGAQQSALDLQNILGSNTITGCHIHDNDFGHNVFITQNSGTTPTINFTNNAVDNVTIANPTSSDGLQIQTYNNATFTANVSANGGSCTFTKLFGNGVTMGANGSSTLNATLNNCTIDKTSGVFIQSSGTTSMTANVTNNTITNKVSADWIGAGTGSNGITIGKSSNTSSGTFTGVVTSNSILKADCGGGCIGIDAGGFGLGTTTMTINNNTIQHVDAYGIRFVAGQATSENNVLTIQGNNISNPDAGVTYPIDIEDGSSAGDNPCLAANIGNMTGTGTGNTITGVGWLTNVQTGGFGTGPTIGPIRNFGTFKLFNFPGGTDTQAQQFIVSANPGTSSDAVGGFVGGTSCP